MEIPSNNSLVINGRQDKMAVSSLGTVGKHTAQRQQTEKFHRGPADTLSHETMGIYYTYSLNNSLEFRKTDYMGIVIDTYA